MHTVAQDAPAINNRRSAAIRSLDDLADMPRWVAWREETRQRQDGSTYTTKIPYDPRTGRQARIPTDPSTWGTRERAERRWDKLDRDGHGGVGVVLGDLGDGYCLMGIDLDRCLKPKRDNEINIDPFVNEIIERFDTYAEVSPSGKGIKLFFLVNTDDMEPVQRLLGFDNGKPKARKSFGAGEHREVAIDRARFYAVTGEHLEGSQTFRIVGVKDIRWFIEQAGPKFQRLHRGDGGKAQTHKRDESGSGYGYRFFGSCKALKKSFAQAWEAILQDHGKAGEWARRTDERQLQRTWERAYPRRFDDVQPKLVTTTPTVTAHELNKMEFPEIRYVVPGVIVEGLTIFAGKPKIGKSWMMLQVANAVANGIDTLGGIHCKRGDVLYCALEDHQRRLQRRMDKMRIAQWSKRLHFRCEMPRLDEGGLEVIRDWLETVSKPRLVIIDTFKRVRPKPSDNVGQYDADYDSTRELLDLAHEFRIAIVLVHHQRKMDADDPYDTVSGTLGLTATPDTIVILRRDQSGNMVMQARGRDLEEIEKAMKFAKQTCQWKIVGNAEEVRKSSERAAVIKALQAIGESAKPSEVAAEGQLKLANVSKLLAKMARDGQVHKHGYGKYGLERPAGEAQE